MRKQKWLGLVSGVTLAATLSVGAGSSYAQRNYNYQGGQNQYRGNQHDRFDDNDRNAFRGWWDAHRNRPPVGFRDRDRLPPQWESRFRIGAPLDPYLRQRARPVPVDLYRRLAPPPPSYRYMVVGDHVVLVDNGYRLHDVFHFELNF